MKAEAEDKVESLYREQFQLLIRSAQFDIEEQGRYNFAIDCLLSLEEYSWQIKTTYQIF